jgi:hypothetical protein
MTGPTKAELQQRVDDLQAQVRAIDTLTDAAKAVSAVATWDREARAISRCVVAIESLKNSDRLRSDLRADVGRVLRYLAARYGVPMADPTEVQKLSRSLDAVSDELGSLRQEFYAQDEDQCAGGCR